MKNFLFIYLLLFSINSYSTTISVSANGTDLRLAYVNSDLEIHLPQKALDALKKWNPDFNVFSLKDYAEPIKELFEIESGSEFPMAFISDLNNDKHNDLVLLGEAKQTQFAIALVQSNNNWKVIEVKKWNIFNVRESTIPEQVKNKKQLQQSVPFYVLQPDEDALAKMKGKKGIQIEEYMGQPDVYILNGDTVSIFPF